MAPEPMLHRVLRYSTRVTQRISPASAVRCQFGDIEFSLILIHAEDQLMQAETFRVIAEDFIDVYEKLLQK